MSNSSYSIFKEKTGKESTNSNIIDLRETYQQEWISELKDSLHGEPLTFKKLIDAAIKNYPHGSLSKKSIGEKLGYKESQIKNIIGEYNNSRAKSRDLIIAICICADLTATNTNRGLELYKFHRLNEEDDRDFLIKCAIDNIGKERNLSLEQLDFQKINDSLIKAGKGSLNIHLFQNIQPQRKHLEQPSATCEILLEDIYCLEFPGFNAISMKYDPDALLPSATATVRKKNDPTIYEIETGGTSFSLRKYHEIIGEHFKDASECPESAFISECYKIQRELKMKSDAAISMMDDTKNYRIRYDCRVENGIMKTYAETYDYENPEFGEYFQMVKYGTSYTMTVTQKSQFLRYHIGNKEYKKFYSIKAVPVLLSFESLEDIRRQKDLQNELKGPTYIFHEKRMEKMFEQLRDQITTILNNIKNGTTEIFDITVFDEYYRDPAAIMNIESYFEWEQAEDYPVDVPDSLDFEIELLDGQKRIVTFDEVRKAIQVGISSFDDLKIILSKFNNIEDFILL